MLDGLRDRRSRKGHAYSRVSWEGFRLLPSSTQIGLALASLFVFLVLLALIAPSTYKAPVKVAEKDVTELLEGDSTTVEIKKEDKTVKPMSDEKYTKLREQVKVLLDETQSLKKQLEARKSGSSNAVAVSAPSPIGNFDWESLKMEPNSTERRFWVKTATNEEGHHFYRRILISNGWVETSNPNHEHCYFLFYGRFVPNLDQEFDMFQEGKHMINHIPGEFAVLNKEPFLHYIRDWSAEHKCDYTAMHPESYLLHVEKDCEDAFRLGNPENALVRTGETQEERDESYWFWKPPFNSFGRGIKVSQLKVLREQFGFGKALENEPDQNQAVKERCQWLAQNLTESKNKLLIQRAVDKPFLIKKSKFDFRAYILIANAQPYNVYFKFGHARRCLYDFDIKSKIKKAHVCNDYSDDLETPGFPLHEHIWTYDTFKEHLMSLGYTSEQVEKGFNDNMKRLFLGVFHTFKDAIPRKNGYWLLLGLDVAIDENWEVKVLEINTNPSIHYATRVWGPGMAERNWKQMNEILHLVYDSHEKTKKYGRKAWKKKDLIMSTKYGFELIYSDAVSPPYQYVDEPCFKQQPLKKHP